MATARHAVGMEPSRRRAAKRPSSFRRGRQAGMSRQVRVTTASKGVKRVANQQQPQATSQSRGAYNQNATVAVARTSNNATAVEGWQRAAAGVERSSMKVL